MQAYMVSKRPPRALFLGLAIALGMVAMSTVVLTQGGGLLRDGTYLRLLGYAPSNRGASELHRGSGEHVGPESRSDRSGRPCSSRGQFDPRRSDERLVGFLRLWLGAQRCGPGPWRPQRDGVPDAQAR